MCSRSGQIIYFAEFIQHCSNSISKTNPSANCAEKSVFGSRPHTEMLISCLTEMILKSTKNKVCTNLKSLQWMMIDGHENHEQVKVHKS